MRDELSRLIICGEHDLHKVAGGKAVHNVAPILHHASTLVEILRLVVDRTDAPLFVS